MDNLIKLVFLLAETPLFVWSIAGAFLMLLIYHVVFTYSTKITKQNKDKEKQTIKLSKFAGEPLMITCKGLDSDGSNYKGKKRKWQR